MCVVIPQTRAISVLSVNLRVNACVYLSVERVCVCVCVCDTDHAESVSLQRGYGGFLFSPSVNVWGALCREWAGPMGDGGGGGGGHNQLPSMMCPISVVYGSHLHFFSLLTSLVEPLVFQIK